MPTSAGSALVADDTVAVLLGRKWLPATPPIRLISLYAAVRVIDGGLPSLMLARQRERFLFWYSVVPLIAMPGWRSRRSLDEATGLIVFYTTAYRAVMIFLAKEALVELKEKVS